MNKASQPPDLSLLSFNFNSLGFVLSLCFFDIVRGFKGKRGKRVLAKLMALSHIFVSLYCFNIWYDFQGINISGKQLAFSQTFDTW